MRRERIRGPQGKTFSMQQQKQYRTLNGHSRHNDVRVFAILFPVVFCLAGAAAQTPEGLFASANELYRAGKFAESARSYEAILNTGMGSAEVYFNLGNAYYRLGSVGKSILAYERAAVIEPGNNDIQFNLQIARLRAIDRIDPVPEMFLYSWLRSFSSFIPVTSARNLFLIFWGLSFISLSALFVVRAPAILSLGRTAFLAGFVFAILFGSLFAAQAALLQEHDMAVILASTVTVKSSPDPGSVDAFVIHEGLKVQVNDSVGDWVKVTLADGKVGWVQQSDVERI